MPKDWIGDLHSVAGCMGAAGHSQEEREQNDYYATDPVAAEWLLKLEDVSHNVWECACGEGHLAKVFEASGRNVKATDLIDRGYGQGGVNFLECNEPFNGDIITNPPYRFTSDFIYHALDLIPEGRRVYMFLKVQYLEGKARRKLYENAPPLRVWVSSSRIQCGKNGDFKDSMVAYAWFVWQKGYAGPTELRWFN